MLSTSLLLWTSQNISLHTYQAPEAPDIKVCHVQNASYGQLLYRDPLFFKTSEGEKNVGTQYHTNVHRKVIKW